jgi:hypothetical protein
MIAIWMLWGCREGTKCRRSDHDRNDAQHDEHGLLRSCVPHSGDKHQARRDARHSFKPNLYYPPPHRVSTPGVLGVWLDLD